MLLVTDGCSWLLIGADSQRSILKAFVERKPQMNDMITFVQIQEKFSLIPICSDQDEHRSATYTH